MLLNTLLFATMSLLTPSNATPNGDSLSLTYLVRAPKVNIANPPLLILLHGVGSNEADLFSLADQLNDSCLIVSARAPFVISEGSYKWYDVSFASGKPQINPAQAEQSRQILLTFIDELKAKYKVNEKRIYLGGFSQGAIMSFSVALTAPEKIHGFIALSGRVLDEVRTQMVATDRFKALHALIIHGTKDNVLPVQYAQQSLQLMQDSHIDTEYHELPIAHNVSMETIRLVNEWLMKH